jgi:hypothetical protein
MNQQSTLGVDIRENGFFLAELDNSGARPRVKRLLRRSIESPEPVERLNGSSIRLAVPDGEVIVKPISVTGADSNEIKQRARFELGQTMLDPEDHFDYESVTTGRNDRYLGLIYRKQSVRQLEERFQRLCPDSDPVSGFQARSLALALGYLSFCHTERGDFLALVDFGTRDASVAFLYQREIVALSSLPVNIGSSPDDDFIRSLAVDLKTIINYRLAALAEEGITVPVSTLVLSGDQYALSEHEPFCSYFPVEIVQPRLNMGYLGDMDTVPEDLDHYLPALGLSVN